VQPLSSVLESRELPFSRVRSTLGAEGFSLGGDWSYSRGSFDRPLGEAHKVWLRLPFEVTSGMLDAESDESDATIRFGTPFALRHEYNEGLADDAQPRTYGALIDQFQEPVDPDAPLEAADLDRAKRMLRRAEELLS